MKSEEKVHVNKGLRQGCPLSPLLFMMHMVRMERALEGSNIGCNLSYKQTGTVVEQQLPGLFYADDIVLRANKQSDLQRLANICGQEGNNLGFKFSVRKSGVMVFNENSEQTVEIQGQEIPRVTEYKYLGIWINEGNRYMKTQEKSITVKGKINAAIMKHRALWGYNRYEVLRGMWKGVMVPGLTFGNAVVCLKSGVQSGLDGNQRSVGRLALDAHGKTTNEAVQGDMGWTSFEVREARSKIEYEERLRNMEENKWAGRVFRYLYRKNIYSQWRKRTRKLTSKYVACRVGNTATKTVKRKVREAEIISWVAAMERKPAMSDYLRGKNKIRKETIYDNSKGSSLLFEARSGYLRIRTYRARYKTEEEACACCGKARKAMEHVLLECEDVYPAVNLGATGLLEALGFSESSGKVNMSAVGISKRRLEDWWNKSRETKKKKNNETYKSTVRNRGSGNLGGVVHGVIFFLFFIF
nr:uncharacterized protein LOC126531471 [Dermacentor andersoni]